ncbi:hypothetical protein P8C59_008681 [Phyllachora maydis]|uniref:Dynactin subunit 6 n=1 Tax=Phyllachora maydis TaxID=1825666 RepID=A0AAD9MH73_9PEZI|nr:hypothetical protein P8C59_008681 [Phyllachora maydis]
MSSTTSSSNKRNSIVPPLSQAGPRPAVKIAPSVTIDGAAHLTGSHPIGIGAESVIHPRAKLNSLGGRITVGRRCIVEERATLGAPSAEARQGVTLGDYVVVHVDAVVEAGGTVVQDGAVIGVGARVGKGAVIGKYCTLAPMEVVAPGEALPDYTVVYGNGLRRTDRSVILDEFEAK